MTSNDTSHRRPARLVHELNNLVFLVTAYTNEMLEQVPPEHPFARDLSIVAEAGRKIGELSARVRALEDTLDEQIRTRRNVDDLVAPKHVAI